MTRDKAIKQLEINKKDDTYVIDDEVFDMAIKALQESSCEDAVSRKDMYFKLTNGAYPNETTEQFIDRLVKELEDMPPVTPTQKWIPVSERLPENKTYVLTTIKVPNRIAHARSGWYEGGFFHNDNGDVWRSTDMEVLAWMPLPKPYKTETESEE